MRVAVIGTGYVGLVTGSCLAEMGNHVVCVDNDKSKVARLNKGEVPIYEPHLENLFARNFKEQRLIFTTSLKDGVKDAEIIFLALPTPPNGDGSADLSIVMQVADELGKLIDHYVIVVDKSTVPIGTAEKVRAVIAKNASDEFDVVSNPEFLREGFAVDDFMKPDRVVIGSSSRVAIKKMKELYKPFVRQGNPIYVMDERSAEMTKYAANSFLAAKISFMNEIANLSEKVGANVDMVRAGIGSDERIGKRFLFAGIGYGGSCFPKDVQALAFTAKENKYDFKILDAVQKVNAHQKQTILYKVIDFFGGKLKGKTIAVWGLAFKPDTDDIREAPALEIIKGLLKKGAKVVASDPEAIDNVKKVLSHKNLSFEHDHYKALKDADALVIATEWEVFRSPEFEEFAYMKEPIIFDGRNVYDLDDMRQHGFYYASVGREVVDGRG